MRQQNLTNQKGFTILELLIASLVFSVIFMGVSTALIQVGRLYYKGTVTARTQETTRSIVDRISQQLQFTKDDFTPVNTVPTNVTPGGSLDFKAICIGSTRYSFVINAQVNPDVIPGGFEAPKSRLQHALWRDTVSNPDVCDPVNLSQKTPSANGAEMLDENMRLSKFEVTCTDSDVCTVSVGVMYGDNDLLEPDPTTAVPANCKTANGSQWCASARFTTSVLKRVGG